MKEVKRDLMIFEPRESCLREALAGLPKSHLLVSESSNACLASLQLKFLHKKKGVEGGFKKSKLLDVKHTLKINPERRWSVNIQVKTLTLK